MNMEIWAVTDLIEEDRPLSLEFFLPPFLLTWGLMSGRVHYCIQFSMEVYNLQTNFRPLISVLPPPFLI